MAVTPSASPDAGSAQPPDQSEAWSADQQVAVCLTVNGRPETVTVPTSATALHVLRERLGLTGIRASCERAVCGACTILVDSRPVASCAVFAWDLEGHEVETIEGFASDDGELSPEQQAFIDCGAFQCGFCTSGMVTLTTGLLREEPQPSAEDITAWISSNICRCTGYKMIIEAVERAADLRAEKAAS